MLTSVGVAKLSGACLVQYHDPSPPVCINGPFWGDFQANVEPTFKAGVVSHLAALSRKAFDKDPLLHEQFWH